MQKHDRMIASPLSQANGWLILDKPRGIGSTAAVARVRRIFAASKAGHGGTLDPLATGVLPIALNEATKTVSNVMHGSKTYCFTVAWGAETSTDDLEGALTSQSDVRPSEEAIRAALPAFIGRIAQVPPAFSAVKIAGERAYARARGGEDISLPPRMVEVYALRLLGCGVHEATFELDCGKGTYVRSLARDMGRRLNCGGHVVSLRRLRTGPFGESDMISLAKLEEFSHNEPGRKAILKFLRPLRTALDDIPALALGEAEAWRLRQGQPVAVRAAGAHPEQGTVLVLSGETPVALAAVKDGVLRSKRVFNL
jgi:tRNA pseudouridine55 synthase